MLSNHFYANAIDVPIIARYTITRLWYYSVMKYNLYLTIAIFYYNKTFNQIDIYK